MLDFSKFTDFLSDLAGQSLAGGAEGQTGLLDLMQAAGLDPSALTGLNENEIMTLLSEHGIDVSQFAHGEIAQVLSDLGFVDAFGVFGENSQH